MKISVQLILLLGILVGMLLLTSKCLFENGIALATRQMEILAPVYRTHAGANKGSKASKPTTRTGQY